MFERPAKLPTPKTMAPAASPRGGVVEHLLARLDTQARLLDDASGYDWRTLRMASPAVPLPIKPFNLGDVFFILVVHGDGTRARWNASPRHSHSARTFALASPGICSRAR